MQVICLDEVTKHPGGAHNMVLPNNINNESHQSCFSPSHLINQDPNLQIRSHVLVHPLLY